MGTGGNEATGGTVPSVWMTVFTSPGAEALASARGGTLLGRFLRLGCSYSRPTPDRLGLSPPGLVPGHCHGTEVTLL